MAGRSEARSAASTDTGSSAVEAGCGVIACPVPQVSLSIDTSSSSLGTSLFDNIQSPAESTLLTTAIMHPIVEATTTEDETLLGPRTKAEYAMDDADYNDDSLLADTITAIDTNDDSAMTGPQPAAPKNHHHRLVQQKKKNNREYDKDPYFERRNHYNNNARNSAAVTMSEDDYEEPEDDFIRRIYDTTIDGPCQGVLPVCQLTIEQQLDLFTHCRQPLEFLSLFREHPYTDPSGTGGADVMPVSMYVVPTFCEYCGSESVQDCDHATCQRPALYFQKKRPPFSKPNRKLWDPATDHAVIVKQRSRRQRPTQRMSWVSELFGKNE